MGGNFCSVDKTIAVYHSNLFITLGSQIKLGGFPNFNKSPKIINNLNLTTLEIIKLYKIKNEPKAWIKKYFIIEEFTLYPLLLFIRGMKHNILISNITHTSNKFSTIHIIKTLQTKISINMNLPPFIKFKYHIKKGNTFYFFLRLEALNNAFLQS